MANSRSYPKLGRAELAHGIPVFLDQVAKTLAFEQRSSTVESEVLSRSPAGPESGLTATAMRHGRDLFEQGFSVEQVIRDYGDACQAVTSLAVEVGTSISANEFRSFNRCLDDAIAGAVSEYSRLKHMNADAANTVAINAERGIEELKQLWKSS